MPSFFEVRPTSLMRSTLAALVGAITVLAAPPLARADDANPAAAVIAKLRVQEAPQPVRERAQWRGARHVK
jgi:hypothetical protein